MTGNPYPSTPEERMYLGPHVRTFVQNITRQGASPYEIKQEGGLKRAINAIGKTALAAGLLVGGAMAAHHYLGGGPPPPPGAGGEAEGFPVTSHETRGREIADSLNKIHEDTTNVLEGKGITHAFSEPTHERSAGVHVTKIAQPYDEVQESPGIEESRTYSADTPAEPLPAIEANEGALPQRAPRQPFPKVPRPLNASRQDVEGATEVVRRAFAGHSAEEQENIINHMLTQKLEKRQQKIAETLNSPGPENKAGLAETSQPSAKSFLRQKIENVPSHGALDVARRNVQLRLAQGRSDSPAEVLNEHDPAYLDLYRRHAEMMRQPQVEPESPAHLAQLSVTPGVEEHEKYRSMYGRMFPVHFKY